VERGVADASSAAAIARISDGRPGLALALAAAPEVLVHRGALARSLLDLISSGRRQRLAAAPSLLADAAALAEVVDRRDGEAPSDEIATAAPVDPAEGLARAAPAARRAASLALIETWREVARDLVVVLAGGPALARDLALLEDYERVAAGVTIEDVAGFLARLDGLAAAIEAYANADLVVDVLLLAWPRSRLAA